MKVIVDTNIVFSAILNSQSWIGQILLHSDKSIKFYSPRFLQVEIQNHLQKIKKLTKLSDSEVSELIAILYTKIHFISEEFIPKETLQIADELTKDIDFDDVLFVALAIHFNCKLWTGDKVLMNSLKLKGFHRFISSQELLVKLKK
ncbi:MAG: PIN domain-containing protein [Ignavibacteria bacterium]|jgi:predicted nucleic acid-binding protein|nr:PIN domain-containing protein [Ignavibacteria bacterium]